MDRRRLLAMSAALALFARAAPAYLPPAPIRGKIVSVEGRTLILAGRDGQAVRVVLAQGARIVTEHRGTAAEEIEAGRLLSLDASGDSTETLTWVSQIFVLERSAELSEGRWPVEGYLIVRGRTSSRVRVAPPSFTITVNGTPTLIKVGGHLQIIIYRREDGDESLLVPGATAFFDIFDAKEVAGAWTVDRLFVDLDD